MVLFHRANFQETFLKDLSLANFEHLLNPIFGKQSAYNLKYLKKIVCAYNLRHLKKLVCVELERICNNHEPHTFLHLWYTSK